MSRIKRPQLSSEFHNMRRESQSIKETNDCAVIAVATSTGVSYKKAHAELMKAGRKTGEATPMLCIFKALNRLGFRADLVRPRYFIDQYPGQKKKLKNVTTHQPDRFPKVWRDGNTYLLRTKRHILTVKNGLNCDWTRGRAMQAVQIFKVVKSD